MSAETLIVLQFWGGTFYLLNKIFFSVKERRTGEAARQWRIWSWIAYLTGLPAWIAILAHENNWMVTLVEIGGAPSMLLGLVIAMQHLETKPSERRQFWGKTLEHLAWISACVGIAVSFYRLGVMTESSQWWELGVSIGFLVGTYRLAYDKLDGYVWFALMNFSAGALMFTQGYELLGIQQVLSLAFVFDAYKSKRRREKNK